MPASVAPPIGREAHRPEAGVRMSRSIRRSAGWHRVLAAASVPLILLAGLAAGPPVRAEDEIPVATWYLPIDTRPVCIGQQVRIAGQYDASPGNGPLAPLAGVTIVNQATHGTVSPQAMHLGPVSGYFSFTFTATSAGLASISSSIPGAWGTAKVALKVTDTCEYVYGFRVDFDMDLGKSGATMSGSYHLWGGGYLKAKDPNNTSALSNDQEDTVRLGGRLVRFNTKGCQGSGQALPEKSTSLTVTGTVSDPTIDIRITKGRFNASGTWSLTCAGSGVKVQVPDALAGAMTMMDAAASGPFATGTCMASGGECQLDVPPLAFMLQFFPGSSPATAVLILQKVK
jgi:hypothetical protein